MSQTSTASFAFSAWRSQLSRPGLREPLFGEVAEQWFARQVQLADGGLLRPSGLHRFESALRAHLLPFFAARPLRDVDRERCDAYRILALNAGQLTAGTINSIVEILRLVLRDAHRRGLLATDPLDGMRPLPEPRRLVEPYDTDELSRLIDAIPPPGRIVVALAGLAGLRQGEIYALRPSDIDLPGRVISITRSLQRPYNGLTVQQRLGSPKTPNSRRQVPLQRRLAVIVEEHLEGHLIANPYELMCCKQRGAPLDATEFQRGVLVPAIKAAGLRPMRFHDLRRTFIAQCVAAGIPTTQTAAWLGHTTSVMTDYYFMSGARQRDNALTLLDAEMVRCNA